jgi:hypothetical protein
MFDEVASRVVLVTNTSRYGSPGMRSGGAVTGAATDPTATNESEEKKTTLM